MTLIPTVGGHAAVDDKRECKMPLGTCMEATMRSNARTARHRLIDGRLRIKTRNTCHMSVGQGHGSLEGSSLPNGSDENSRKEQVRQVHLGFDKNGQEEGEAEKELPMAYDILGHGCLPQRRRFEKTRSSHVNL